MVCSLLLHTFLTLFWILGWWARCFSRYVHHGPTHLLRLVKYSYFSCSSMLSKIGYVLQVGAICAIVNRNGQRLDAVRLCPCAQTITPSMRTPQKRSDIHHFRSSLQPFCRWANFFSRHCLRARIPLVLQHTSSMPSSAHLPLLLHLLHTPSFQFTIKTQV